MSLKNADERSSPSVAKQEQGVILILFVIFLPLFIGLAALAIEITQQSASREQMQQVLRLSSLAALDRYFTSTQATTTGRAQDAIARAQAISGMNYLLADSLQGNGQSSMVKNQDGTGDGATLTLGVWYFANDTSQAGEECTTYPCFVAANMAAADPRVTAVKITGSIRTGTATKFARAIFGEQLLDVHVSTVATVIPRHGCFIVDLSGSMIRETHITRTTANQAATPLNGRGTEASFVLSTENPGEPNLVDSDWTWLSSTTDRPTSSAQWTAFLSPVDPSTMTNTQYSKMHFRDDYSHLLGLGDKDFRTAVEGKYHPNPASNANYQVKSDGSTTGMWYRADTFRDYDSSDGYTYEGPQPLGTVLDGLKSAMERFKSRRVSGDEACIIMYDNRLAWPRMIKLTNNFDYLLEITDGKLYDAAGIAVSGSGKAADDGGSPDVYGDKGLVKLIRHGIIPGGVNASNTNTYLALTEASSELQSGNAEGGFSSDFVVAIGDGLANCQQCINSPYGGCTPGECSNDYQHWQQAVKDLNLMVRNNYQNKNVPIHWIMVGALVQPHTLDIKENDSAGPQPCMSDEQARQQNISLVAGGWDSSFASAEAAFDGMSPSKPFWESNKSMYEIVAGTRGLWGPIRPKATGCTRSTEATCNTSADSASSAARITTDPLCRTPSEQIQDYMDRIIGDNPYTIVEVE